jgi:hypothetical protein
MKKLAILAAFILTGCSTVVPVKAKFPDVPEILTNKCPPLKQLKDDTKLSEISKTVTENYTSYYECAVLVEHWNEWYTIQKQIYEKVGK